MKRTQHKTKISTIEGLATLMMGEFARVDEQFLAINEQLVSINGELKNIRLEMKEINRRLDTLESDVKDIRGYAKEIDELRARVKSMETFLQNQGMKVRA